jgi:hypothetical protein
MPTKALVMTRFLPICCFALVACFTLPSQADVVYEKAKDGDTEIDVVRMVVSPAAESVPAFRHRLMAREVDLKTGNSVPFYYRAQAEMRPTMKRIREKFDEEKELDLWYSTGDESTPIAKLPLEKMREVNQMFDPIYRNYLRPAFECSECNWELGVRELRGVYVVSFLLPEFNDSRELARMMALRTRLAIAERRYDDAIVIMQNQYRLGHDVATVPFLVCGLIGIAIDGISNGTLIDMIGNPDSPNMYWALTELPQPLVNMQPAARFEMDFGPRMFPFIDRAETAEHAPEEWNRLFRESIRDFTKVTGEGPNLTGNGNHPDPLNDAKAGVAATGLGLIGYTHAKERLIAQGMERNELEKMAVGQVIAIYTERIYRRFSEDYEKLWYMPFADVRAASETVEKNLRAASFLGSGEDRELLPIVSVLMPAIQNVRSAQVRLEREIAALRVIESLRMYAADHDGQFPKKLDEITAVPVPSNPATSKPFEYRLDGKTAVLNLPPSDGLLGGNRRYEIQIAEKGK